MNRIIETSAGVLGCLVLVVGGSWCVRSIRMDRYDKAFHVIQIGDTKQDVVVRLGTPHEDKPAKKVSSRAIGIERFLVYRIGVKGRGGMTWTIGLNEQGEVVSKHRDANGC